MPELDKRAIDNQGNRQIEIKSYPRASIAWAVWVVGASLYAIGFFLCVLLLQFYGY